MAIESTLKRPNIWKALDQRYRLIRAKAIYHHHIPRPTQSIERPRDIILFIVGENNRSDLIEHRFLAVQLFPLKALWRYRPPPMSSNISRFDCRRSAVPKA